MIKWRIFEATNSGSLLKGDLMLKKSLPVLLIGCLVLNCAGAEIKNLSDVFSLGKGIEDQDNDGFADRVALCIVIPDHPSVFEIAAASDIAARANFESLVVDFNLVKKESEYKKLPPPSFPIFIGANLKTVIDWVEQKEIRLNKDQGLVSLLNTESAGLVLAAGSGEALLQTARAFFLRWPYLWEIWGREEGETYMTLEKDIERFFESESLSFSDRRISSAHYDFPTIKSPHEALQKLKFNRGEIQDLVVAVEFESPQDRERASQALEDLRDLHKQGIKTDTLSYSGCSRITFELRCRGKVTRVLLPRVGYPKRMLTPSFKPSPRQIRTGKEFDLLQLFTVKGFYGDSDNDRIKDALESVMILPKNAPCQGIDHLASRLVLETAGAAFPIVHLDQDIESEEALKAPIIIGRENRFYQDLVRTGKMKNAQLEKGWGRAQIVPEAVNKSSALVVWGEDEKGLERILSYLGRTFPYFHEFKEGNPSFHDIPIVLEEFLVGKHGSAESYIWQEMKKSLEDLKDKKLAHLDLQLYLPEKNPDFSRFIREYMRSTLDLEEIDVQDFALRDSQTIFLKEKEFTWEGDDAFGMVQEQLKALQPSSSSLFISIGVSESPAVRKILKEKIEALLTDADFGPFKVEVHSAYKQGFFWIKENVIPALKNKRIHRVRIRFAREAEDLSQPKRFYSEPYRWLQELYPVDEFIAEEAQIPLEMIEFEMKEESEPVYEVLAFDENNQVLLRECFSPHTKEIPYLRPLPEWGKVKLTTSWVKIMKGDKAVVDTCLPSDLEKFWDFYQEEILREVYDYILKNTGNKPTFKKQPYFKRLLIEMWFSEPDYRLGLDEEIVSSLESMHDEIYFDTLDFLRGITEEEKDERQEDSEDTPSYSAPGNILPMIYPSSEGKKGKIRITFEGWKARSPQTVLEWKEEGRREKSEKFTFPRIKETTVRIPSFTYNGSKERVENLVTEMAIEKEEDYLLLLEIIESFKELLDKKIMALPFDYPYLHSLTVKTRHKEWEKEETFTLQPPVRKSEVDRGQKIPQNISVPTEEIISPRMCLNLVDRLSSFEAIRSYIGGKSYEGREIPVMEVFTPLGKYVSIPRLITLKPSLYLSGRQHANEVSSTNYILKFAELLAIDEDYKKFTEKINFILHPMENPDGAELAYDLQKLTPFHSLHAGRYTSLGIDVGYQVGASKPFLPEAKVRKNLFERWLPDIHLNLHGYPSHEWVQQFSNYSPYLFRDFWIPRGWYVIYRSLSLPIYQKRKQAGEQLQEFIVREIQDNERFMASSKKFHDRYYRWAGRWQPHMDYLEIHEAVNMYAKRRSSLERKISDRSRMTYVEETPELMDETAQGQWLDSLCDQGLTYLRAHAKYLSQAGFEIVRIEEESQDRVKIQFVRSRPGKVK